jgi:phage-related protein
MKHDVIVDGGATQNAVRVQELEQRLAEAQITKHSGDCRWWSYRICDCGYLMRANSGDFGEPSEQVTKDWLEHSANCSKWSRTIYERDEWKRHCQNIAPNTAKKIQAELDATEALKAKEEK